MELSRVATEASAAPTDHNSQGVRDDLRDVMTIDLKLSLKELAHRLRVPPPDLSRALSGGRGIDYEWIERDREICLLMRERQARRLGLTPEAKRQLRIDRIKTAMGLLVDEAAEVGA